MKKKMIIYSVNPINTDVTDLRKFEDDVRKVAALGATHVLITEIPKSRWIWEKDLNDPYPNWGMLNSALFKIIVPKELAKYLPCDYANRNLEIIKARSEILRKYQLKAAAYFCEPFYLPEEAFRDHPDWRGPRCDHPRRARKAYYSPCLDNEEILAMYREAMRELCKVCDIDYVYLHTNDCGAGICWSDGLYCGTNGPEKCKDIPLSTRIINFFRVLRNAGKEVGRDIYIETNSNIGFKDTAKVMNTIWPLLDDKMAVNFKTNKGTPLSSVVDLNHEFTYAPIQKLPYAFTFLELLEKAYYDNSPIMRIVMIESEFDEYHRIIAKFNEQPTKGVASRMNLLSEIASEIVGKEKSSLLVDSWYLFDQSLKHYFDTCIEGLTWVSVNQRLINRPFVLFPEELTAQEKSYYRPFQIQAQAEEFANNLLDNQGTAFVQGKYAGFMACNALKKVLKLFATIKANFYELSQCFEIFKLAINRIDVLSCFIKNYYNAINFQNIMDQTDYSQAPALNADWPQEADPRLIAFETITRAEIDNTYELIDLLKGAEREYLTLAPSADLEDCFWLSPYIVKQLQKKIEIMSSHILDGKRLFITYNK